MTKELTQGDGLSRPGIGGTGRPCITLPDTEEINEILAELDRAVLQRSMRAAVRDFRDARASGQEDRKDVIGWK